MHASLGRHGNASPESRTQLARSFYFYYLLSGSEKKEIKQEKRHCRCILFETKKRIACTHSFLTVKHSFRILLHITGVLCRALEFPLSLVVHMGQ